MRIALSGWFWDRPDTGSGQYVRRLLVELRRYSDELLLILPHPISQGDLRVTTKVIRASGGPLGKVAWEQVAVPRAAQQWRADVLHVPYWAPPLVSAVPVVVTIHDLIPLLLPAYRGGTLVRLYTSLVRWATRYTAQVITDSHASRADILAHLRVPPEKVHPIWLASDERYRPAPAPEDGIQRQPWGLESGYVLYLGGFDVRKNLAALMGAFALARRDVPHARLVVAGKLPAQDTSFTPCPRRLAREAGVPDEAIAFTGFVPESAKAALYRGARVFAFPSRYEGFGLPPLESIACGTPVVGSNAASLPEVVGEAGFLHPPDDVAGMGDSLVKLLTSAALRDRVAAKAQQQARRFSWGETARQTYEVYQQT